MRSWLRHSWPALALAALALALRCYGMTAPLLDYHAWRQADTAAIARNYAMNGYFLPYPQVDWGGQTPGYVESEFPLYTYTLALLYGLFGVYEPIGRMVAALAGAGSAAALYGLARSDDVAAGIRAGATGQGRVAMYAGIALALMPFPIYFGRAVMPDTWMLLAAIPALWTFRRWLERPSIRRYVVALLCGTLAPLAKTPNLMIVAVPLAYLALAGYILPLLTRSTTAGALDDAQHATTQRLLDTQHRFCVIAALVFYGLCFTLPSLAWLRHARALPLDPRLSFGIGEKLFELRLLLDPQFYLLLARWSVENVITLAGLPLFILGLMPRTENREPRTIARPWSMVCGQLEPIVGQAQHAARDTTHPFTCSPVHQFTLLPHFWLLGVLLFFCAGAAGVVGQDYYILPLAGPAAWFVGIGLDRAQRFLEKTIARQLTKGEERLSLLRPSSFFRRVDYLIPAFALVGLAALSLARVAPLYQTADFYQTLGQRVDLALPPGARVGVIAPAVSEILYYGGRKGWRLDPGVIVPGGLASLPPDLGVRYLLVVDPALTERRDVLTAALREYRRIPAGPYALLLDLAEPGLQRPAELIWETGHLIEEPFLSYWRQAGVEQLGYPISDALDGPEGREQYFERALLLREGDSVKRLPVGRLLLGSLGRPPQPAEVAGPFRALWERAGGEKVLGAPLSPPLEEGGALVQFFEFGMLEAPPGGAPVIGAAGRRLLDAHGLTEERQIELAAQEEH